MIVYVVCTVVLGLIALYQSLVAWASRRAVIKIRVEFTARCHEIADLINEGLYAHSRRDFDCLRKNLMKAEEAMRRP